MTIFGTRLTRRHFKQPPPHLDAPFGLYPISILKPLKGVDHALEENLETFFHLDYPVFEILFTIADPLDPARAVVERLLRKFPRVRARLIMGDEKIGMNPKVNNMARSYRAAAHDWIWITDSNVRVRPDALKRMVAHIEPGVGVLTSVVGGCDPRGFFGHLEAVFLNTYYARWMVVSDRVFGRPCVMGKSMMFQKRNAERFGGLRSLGRFLAEDYMTGEAMRRLGLRIVTVTDPISQPIGRYALGAFWARHVRWGRIRKAQVPLAILAEPLLGSVLSGILGAIGANWLWQVPMDQFLAAHLLIWGALDIWQMRAMGMRWSRWMPLAWFFRELIAIPLWLDTICGDTILWRGRRMRLLPGGILEGASHPALDGGAPSSPALAKETV